MNFSLRLKELREQEGLSQAKLAEILGVGISTIGMWESTQRMPSAKRLNKLISYFGCSMDYLLGLSDNFGNTITQSENGFAMSPLEQQLILDFRKLHPDLQSLLLETVAIWQKQNASSEAAKKKA